MSLQINQTEKPLYIKVNENDNVATIVNSKGLPKGTVFPSGLELKEYIPQGHKVSLRNFEKDDKIIRYGEIIGTASSPISQGTWVKESYVTLPDPPILEKLPLETKVFAPLPPLEGYTFEGYKNINGSVGTKNILGISTSVQCVAGVLDYAVKKIKTELLPSYPNVDDVVALTHNYGCGVAINAPDAVIPIRTLQNLSTHPNFGGEVLVVGLGCEKLLPERLIPQEDSGNITRLQDQAGFKQMVATIIEMAEEKLIKLNNRTRVTCPLSDLTVGLQCGGSDAFSGVTANPAVGYAADLLVRAGATVLFSEVTEVRDAIHLLTPRTINEEVGQSLINEMSWYDQYLKRGEADRSANPSPGNKKGGLVNVVEKALGSIAKAGTTPIVEVLSPGEKPTKKGLIYAATPASDFVCGTLQLASGMNMHIFTTGRGTPYGLAMAPVLKVSTRSSLTEQWDDLIDLDAGRIAQGEATIEEVGWELFHLIIEIASGHKKTWSDYWGLHNDLCLFNPAPLT
ncbi:MULTISPECIES: galactarate dehydratase [Priestia]|uniref:galactarate dehydratase n=1 Tax=Priestia TaxID=2800373 RepID=UPI0005ECB0D7|nr:MULTISPECIES: galactarate dehydratase [Priestia]KJL06606.1 galactarate dehydrogenase [Priestia aryabhattai B8W22]MBX4164482.1 galactarate dehydratase [Priestia megaterium]